MLVAALLGPSAAIVVLTTVLIVQCFLFADGGVLALGANLFNMGIVGVAAAPTFAGALKAALREDPDVVLVGELRDLETMSMALQAAETGLLVFATLHTNSAPETITRLPCALAGGLSIWVVAQLGRRLFGRTAGP